jgi:molybdopterin/thiamine biosynthesis adenylyltransferase/rhodanese-related sulfurtransferase
MEPAELNQYQRHLSLDGFGEENQLKLKRASVLVVGAGGLGCPVLQYLTAAGVGRIGITDDDHVEISNLQRQVLFSHDDEGENKAQVAAVKLAKINPLVTIEPYAQRLTRENCESLFKTYDLIVDGTDNFSSRYLINDACVLFNKPLIHGSIYRFEGMVSVFNYNSGPTYRCLFPEQPDPSSIPSCAEAGVLGVLPGIIGTMQAVEAIKVITGIGSTLSGRVLLYNALSQTTRTINLSVDSKNREIDALPEEVISCKSNPSDVDINSQIEEISEDQLQQMMGQSADLQILDVRESWERELFRIQPSVHIPLGNLPSNQEGLSVLEINPNQNLVIYCKAGVRSRAACEMLQKLGCSKLFNLSNGMDGWLNQFPDLVSSG